MTPHLQPGSWTGPTVRSCPIAQLPVELLSEIFAILTESETSPGDGLMDCRRCALVCRVWARLCRKYIFKTLRITSDNSEQQRVQKFHALVQARPSIKNDVKCLRYGVPQRTSQHSEAGAADVWEAEFLRFNSILTLLSNQSVKEFVLDFIEPPDYHDVQDSRQPWSQLPENFKQMLTTFIRSNPITDLELYRISELPAGYLSPKGWLQPTLTNLHLEWVTICETATDRMDRLLLEGVADPQTDFQIVSGRTELVAGGKANNSLTCSELKIPKLKCFGASDCDLSGLLASMNLYSARGKIEHHPLLLCFTELNELRIFQENLAMLDEITPGTIAKFVQYALRCTHCLEALVLEGHDDTFNYAGLLSDNLSLSSLQTLSHIELVLLIDEDTEDLDPYFYFAEELSRLKSRCIGAQHTSHPDRRPFQLGLKNLGIELRDDLNKLEHIELGAWSRLDEVLAGSAESERLFCKLERVTLYPEVAAMNRPESPTFRQHLRWIARHGFPHLRANQKIKFDFILPEQQSPQIERR